MVSSFLGFCEWFFAHFEAPYFVTPLINGSAIESLYSLLKFGAGGHLSPLNYGGGLARVKARAEVSRVTDSGKGYRDQVVVTPPESMMPSYSITCPAGELITKESNCYGYLVVQYTLPAELCQSELGGRDGSNACTLICIFLGLQFKKQDSPSPRYSTSLPPQWKTAIANAIVDGNTLHDCIFEGQAINLDVEDAFETFEKELELAAYDEKQCHCLNQDLDNLVALFAQSRVRDTQAGVIVADGHTISVLTYAQDEYVIVDTHKHSENGSLIGVSNDIVSLLQWYKKIAQKHFNTTIRMCSLTWLTFKFE